MTGSAARAQDGAPPSGALEVDLELVLAVDISGSVDGFEGQQQRDGYIAAMTHPSVIAAIRSTFSGRIAVTYVEWADAFYQQQVVGWTLIDGADTAGAFAA